MRGGGAWARRLVLLGLVVLAGGCAALPQRVPPETQVAPLAVEPEHVPEPEDSLPPPAPEIPSMTRPECLRVEASKVPVLDDTRRMLEETLCTAALWLDGLFGDQADIAAARRTRGRVELSHAWSQFEGHKTRVRMNVRVELPALKRQVSAFVGLDDKDEFVQGRSEGFALRSQFPQIDDDDRWLAGLGYSLPGTERLRSDFRVGAHGLRRTKLFVQNRWGYNAWSNDDAVLHLRATAFWTTRDGLGVTPGFDYSRVLSEDLLLRWDNVGTLSEETDGFDWRSALITYQNLQKKRAIAYELFVRGATGRDEPLTEYGARAIYRMPLFEERLYGVAVLGYSWPRYDPTLPRDGSANAGVALELPFGQP